MEKPKDTEMNQNLSMATTRVEEEEEEKQKKKKVVCVTGANGFIGSWLVRRLLENGCYTVHATIFPGSDASHLKTFSSSSSSSSGSGGGGGGNNLTIFEANILDREAISKAINGCQGVFHVASPCTLEDPKDPEMELITPAVEGTLNVLEGSRICGVERVVLTSSISAIVPNPSWPNTHPFDESSWTDLDYCKSRQKWYPVSKTLAEKAAWDYAEKHKLDVVAIHPSTCLGPVLQPSLNASCAVLHQLLQGSQDTQECHWLGAVHVRDVANAQILLFETSSASGRYLCTNGIYQFKEFAQIVSRLFPEFPIHRFSEDTQPGMIGCKNAAKKLLDLGLNFTPVEHAVQETVESLKAKGFLG